MCDKESQSVVIKCKVNKIIEKYSYGISSEEIKEFKNQNINEIFLCGTDIDACVLNIAFNLFDNNIKPVFIKELCATSSNNPKIMESAWNIIERNFGKKCIASVNDLY